MEKSFSLLISEFAANLKYEDLPDDVVHHVKRFLFDSIACAVGAYYSKDVNIIRNIYLEMGGHGEASTFCFGDKMPAIHATLVNSLMIRSLDFNDFYWKQDLSHPSDIIPAALSVAEKVNASMKDVIVAIVLAYEFEQRLCEFALPGIRERKWHHASLTQFTSPLVSGKILGLNIDQLVHAIGINACHNHTIGSPTSGNISMMKNMVDPLAVQAGVMAALMAEKGLTGPETIFEGKEGFMDVYGPEWDVPKLTKGLGESFKIKECSMKAFPTETLTNTHITAVLKIIKEKKLNPEQIEEVLITAASSVFDTLFDTYKFKPVSKENAEHSLPYCIAAAIVDKKLTKNSFTEERLKDPKIWDIISRIKGRASDEFEKMFPEKQPSHVEIKTKSGEFYSEYIEYPKGDPREPMTMDDLEIKFASLADVLLSKDRQTEIKDLIFSCDTVNARDFMNQLMIRI